MEITRIKEKKSLHTFKDSTYIYFYYLHFALALLGHTFIVSPIRYFCKERCMSSMIVRFIMIE